jgi:hypothetical protein
MPFIAFYAFSGGNSGFLIWPGKNAKKHKKIVHSSYVAQSLTWYTRMLGPSWPACRGAAT